MAAEQLRNQVSPRLPPCHARTPRPRAEPAPCRRRHPLPQAQAFKELLGLEDLPQTGQQAQQAARLLAATVLASVPPPSQQLSQLLTQHLAFAAGRDGSRAPKQRFVDVATGMRLRCLDWGAGSCGGALAAPLPLPPLSP
jgi:hypothetical protein